MPWPIEFFPPSGKRHSPLDYIKALPKSEQAQITLRLETMSKTEKEEWSHTWVKKFIGEIWQLTAGPHRLMYCLDEHKIVILHACRKVSQKARSQDIDRAKIHYSEYLAKKEQERKEREKREREKKG